MLCVHTRRRTAPNRVPAHGARATPTAPTGPLTTEIDLYEVAGGFGGPPGGLGANALCSSYHWGETCFNDLGRYNTGCLTPAQLDYSERFHTYGVEWTDSEITWDVDGVVYFVMNDKTVPGVTLPLPDPLELKINTAVAWWIDPPSRGVEFPPGQAETFHYVDWVRVYNRVAVRAP